jgi:hypothetical protein
MIYKANDLWQYANLLESFCNATSVGKAKERLSAFQAARVDAARIATLKSAAVVQ